MDQAVIKKPPYFDFDLLREQTAELARAHAGQDTQMRAALVEFLKPYVDQARSFAKAQLEDDGDGTCLCRRPVPRSRTN